MRYYIIEFIFRLISLIRLRLIAPIIGKKNDLTLTPMKIAFDDYIECKFNLPEEYLIRQFKEQDFFRYFLFLFRVNMGHCSLLYWKNYILPGGFFIVEEVKTGAIIGSEFVARDPTALEGNKGSVEWLATDPSHKGKTIVWRGIIAYILASRSTKRLLEENYTINVVNCTPIVIQMYEKLGWKRI